MSTEPRSSVELTGERWREVSQIVDAALDLAPSRRASFIDERCTGDLLLKVQVERFLAACDTVAQSPTFMRERPHQYVGELAEAVGEHAAAAHSQLAARVSTTVGDRYAIHEVIGRGGAATVFHATDRASNQPVALKVLHPELSHSIGADRFMREVKVLASLRHPNIIPLLDSGMAGDLPYYAMPFIQGQTLRVRLQREPQLPLDIVLSIARDVAAALDAAHAQDVLHRDIKPLNILLDGNRALVADFGISRAIESAGGDTLTESGTVLGTPGYMSPEQVSGDVPIDTRSDVYSLACVVFEMLAGEPPYTGSQSRSVLAKQLWAPIPDVGVLRAGLSAGVHDVLRKALSKNPADRFDNATAFVVALASVADARPADSSTLSSNRRARRDVRSVAAALAFLACAAGGWAVWSRGRMREAAILAAADTSRLVVIPYSAATGGPELSSEVLREAAARWSGIAVVSHDAVGDALGDGAKVSKRVRDVVLGFRAARYVHASLEQRGSRLVLHAALFDVRSDDVPLWEVTRDVSSDTERTVREVADALLLRSADSTAIAEGTAGTSSLPARQAFLRGRAALRDWRLTEADSALAASLRADQRYGRAALWLALSRIWAFKDSMSWTYLAEAAAANRPDMPAREQALVNAIALRTRGERTAACASLARLADADPYDFEAWFGAGECLATDDAVLPDPASPTGWRFRSGMHSALLRYRRALSLRPAVLASLRDDQFRRLRRLLWTSASDMRTGRRVGQRVAGFSAMPTTVHDTLAFFPAPSALFSGSRISSMRLKVDDAVTRQRLLFRDVAGAWTEAEPGNPLAWEALSLALSMLGDRSALETLTHAAGVARELPAQARIAVTSAWLHGQFADPSNQVEFRRAREAIDSVLRLPMGDVQDRLALAALAAFVGRVALADSIEMGTPLVGIPQGAQTVGRLSRRLALYAATGVPSDSARELDVRAKVAIAAVPLEQRAATSEFAYLRATALGYPEVSLAGAHLLSGAQYYLIRAINAALRHDSATVRRVLGEMSNTRRAFGLSDFSLDVRATEALLLHRTGDVRGAIGLLEPGLRRRWTTVPSPDAVRAASAVRAMTLRADLAAADGDLPTAAMWGAAVAELLRNADAFLQPTRTRMRAYSKPE